MRKLFTVTVFLLITTLLIACGTDNEGNAENNANKLENEKVNNGDNNNLVINDDEDTNENSNEDGNSDESANSGKYKEDVLDRYPDDMRLGDTQEWERSDGVGQDHIELTLNSFKLVDELDGVKPKNDHFLLLNVTVKNLLDDFNYGIGILKSTIEGRKGGTSLNEREELAFDLDEEEDGISTGNLVYDVHESDYYRVYFFDEYFLLFEDEQSKD